MRKTILLVTTIMCFVGGLFFPVLGQGVNAEIILTIDKIAGPMNTAALLSPDGSQFMYYQRKEAESICFYNLKNVEQKCVSWNAKQQPRGIDASTFTWSPDSRHVVFHLDGLRLLNDTDIWVVEAASGTLTNLTDDSYEGRVLRAGTNFWFDFSPAWSPDSSTIYFLRNAITDGNPDGGVMLYRVPVAGGEAQKVFDVAIPLTEFKPFDSTRLALSSDGKKFAVDYSPRQENAREGIWVSPLDQEQPSFVRILPLTLASYPSHLSFSADGSTVLVESSLAQTGAIPKTDPSVLVRVDATSSIPVSEVGYSLAAGWAPEGSALVYIVRNPLEPEKQGLYYKESPDARGQLILPGLFLAPDPRSIRLVWASGDHVLLSSPKKDLYVVKINR